MYKKQKIKKSFKEFSKDIKEEKIPSVILMYGVEQYLVNWAANSIVKKYVNPASMAMDYLVIDDEAAEPDGIIEACDTFSLFSEKKVVWVKNYKPLINDTVKGIEKAQLEKLANYVENSNEGTILIFSGEEVKEKTILTKALISHGNFYNFETLERGELISFANKRFKSSGIEISPMDMRMLIDETGYFNKESDYRLFNFENDILKVIAHSDGIKIKTEDITQVVSGDMETFVFDLLDGLTNNQKDKAFRILYNKLHEGEEIQPLIGAIISQFEILLTIKQMREDGRDIKEMHRVIGGSEYRIKKLIPFASRYSLDNLKRILSEAYDISWNIFSGMLDSQMAMEMFIAKI